MRTLRRLWCRLFGHDWTTYGWTGNFNWPTLGKECRCCKKREPWPDYYPSPKDTTNE